MSKKRKKRLRLKKPIRVFLIKTGVMAKRVVIATAFGFITVKTFLPVQAEVRQKDLIKNIAVLSNANLTSSKTLKTTVVNTYNTLNNTSEEVDQTKVYITTPIVVTQPTIDNSTITVVTKDGVEAKDSDLQQVKAKTVDLPFINTKNSSKEENVETSEKQSANESQKSEDLSVSDNKPENTEKENSGLAQSVIDSADVSEDSLTPVTTNSLDNKETTGETDNKTSVEADGKLVAGKTDENEEVTEESENSNSKASTMPVIFPEIINPTVKTTEALPIGSSNEETLDLDNVQEEDIENDSLVLVLKQKDVEITDGSQFKPEDYILKMHGRTNILPMLKVESNVKSDTDGDYTVTYNLVDIDGTSVTQTLNVKITLPETIRREQQQRAMDDLNNYVSEHEGNSYDVDGAYNDQCWDLFAQYCEENEIGDKFDYGTQPYGYAYGVSLKYKKSGAYKYFDAVSSEDIQPGDWLFWDRGSSCPLSHVALLIEKYDDGTGLCLSQTEGQGTRLVKIPLDVMDVNFRPKGKLAWGKRNATAN